MYLLYALLPSEQHNRQSKAQQSKREIIKGNGETIKQGWGKENNTIKGRERRVSYGRTVNLSMDRVNII